MTTATDQHVEWFDQWKAARSVWYIVANSHDQEWVSPVKAEAEQQEAALGALIYNTPAKTLQGALVQLDYMIFESYNDGKGFGQDGGRTNAMLSIRAVVAGSVV